MICRFHDANGDGDLNETGDNTLYAPNDANFNVTALLTPDQEGSDMVVERYSYTPYGERTVLDSDFTPDADNASDYNWHNTFQGLRKDEVTGEYQARNRNLNSIRGWDEPFAKPSLQPCRVDRFFRAEGAIW